MGFSKAGSGHWLRLRKPFSSPCPHQGWRPPHRLTQSCPSSPLQHCQILHWTSTGLQQERLRGRVAPESSSYRAFLGKGDTDIKHLFACKEQSTKPGFLIRTARAWGHRAHALSSSSSMGKWGHLLREGLRYWVVQNTMQHYSCASSCESTWTTAFLSQKIEIQLHHLIPYFSYVLLTFSGSNTCLTPQKASATH